MKFEFDEKMKIFCTIVVIIIMTYFLLSSFKQSNDRTTPHTNTATPPTTSSIKTITTNENLNENNEIISLIPTAIVKDEWRLFRLIDKQILSHDVRLFRFELPKDKILGLPIGQHISFRYFDENKKEVIRSYTPTNADETNGHLDFCVKIYFKDVNPKFPSGGKMSQYLESLAIGDSVEMRGPKGNITYHEDGTFTIIKSSVTHKIKPKKLGLIAGGTGITPMLQLMNKIVHTHQEGIDIYLIFANQSENDIFLQSYIEEYPHKNVRVWYTIDHSISPSTWKYSTGYINAEMVRDHLPAPGKDTLILVCGPPPMIKYACEPAFKEVGHEEGHWFAF